MADWNIPINSLICLNGEPKCEVNRIGLLSTSQNPPLHIKFSIRFQARVTAAEADANSASASAVDMAQWIRAIETDTDPCVLPEQALCVTRILEAIYTSAKTGEPVYFDD